MKSELERYLGPLGFKIVRSQAMRLFKSTRNSELENLAIQALEENDVESVEFTENSVIIRLRGR